MSGAVARAAESFRRELDRLGVEPEDPAELGRRAALTVAAELAWREHLRPLGAAEARAMLGLGSRQALHDLVKRGRLLALREKGRTVFPAFQFTPHGRLETLPRVLEPFRGAGVSPYTVASWMVSPQPGLDRLSPAEWLRAGREPGPVELAAKRAAARLSA